jgi:hypoxanthine phosphoribosyltransferase
VRVVASISAPWTSIDEDLAAGGRRAGCASGPAILSPAPASARGQRVLIVDEISSSGENAPHGPFGRAQRRPTEVRTATAFCTPAGIQTDYFALETDQTVIFPWDRKVFLDNHSW